MEKPKCPPLGSPIPTTKALFWKFLPFFVHIVLVAGVATFMLLYIDGHQFNLTSRGLSFVNPDGSVSWATNYQLLQSDVTTLVSLGASVTRVAGSWWAGTLVWRCVLMFMKDGRISLKGVKQVIGFHPLLTLRALKSKSSRIILFLVLVSTFSMDYFGSVLTGSITWRQAYTYLPGSSPLVGIQYSEVLMLELSLKYSLYRMEIITIGASMASIAWPMTRHSKAPKLGLKRVLPSRQYLPVNSTVQNLTLPYFHVESFEWIQDTNATLTDKQKSLIDSGETGPLYGPYHAALIPDDEWGWVNTTNRYAPLVVSETRILAVSFSTQIHGCPNTTAFGPHFQPVYGARSHQCFAAAKVTYKAGAATCRDCRLSSPSPMIFQADIPLAVEPDISVLAALNLAPFVGASMVTGLQASYTGQNPQNYCIDLMSRSYQAAWMAMTVIMPNTLDTDTMVPVPTSQATVVLWRVGLWVILHTCVWFGGLLFVYLHHRYNYPWADDPVFMAFLLDNEKVMDPNRWDGINPWVADKDELPRGLLQIQEGDKKLRRLGWKDE